MKHKSTFSIGPAILVTAAFIGPGTVWTASSAGNSYGFLLLWSVAFSVFATIVLQEMAARLGIVSGEGLSQALKSSFAHPLVRMLVLGLVLTAILIGNAAYQTGNLLGAASGVMALSATNPVETETESNVLLELGQQKLEPTGKSSDSALVQNLVVGLIGAIALVIIWIGRFGVLQMVLTLLVAFMSLLFVIAAIKSGPDWSRVAAGFVPRIPEGAEWLVVGLIGTTVVPYNLFLHASAAARRWHPSNHVDVGDPSQCRRAIISSRWDTVVSVLIGGIVTCAILVTSAVAFHSADGTAREGLSNAKEVAIQLEPVLGSSAKTMFSIGLFAAGLTSAITAPIAAGYAAAGCFGWNGKLSDWRLKATATFVVLVGTGFAIRFGASPKETIILAQVANGLLLPIIAVFLLVMVNRKQLLNQYVNRRWSNAAAVVVILIVSVIGIRNLYQGWEKFQTLREPVVKQINRSGPQDVEPVVSALRQLSSRGPLNLSPAAKFKITS